MIIKLLRKAILKYGLQNFKKEILFSFSTAYEAYQKEAEIVNAEFVKNQFTYNLKAGGIGGFPEETAKRLKGNFGKDHPAFGKKRTKESRDRISKSKKGMIFTKEHKENLSKAKLGTRHSTKTREKMSQNNTRHTAKKIRYLGEVYPSITIAEKLTKISRYLLLKEGSLI